MIDRWTGTYAFLVFLSIVSIPIFSLAASDNPTDQDVHWGDGTTDEMCLRTMYMID